MQSFSSRIWIRVAVFISFDDNHFTTGTSYLTKMDIKTVPQPPYSPDLGPCDFCLFPKLRGCGYETIEEMKEAVMKVIDTLTQEDFHGTLQKLLER